MRHESSLEHTTSLLIQAVLATLAVVVMPAVAAIALASLLPEPRLVFAILIGVGLAGMAATIGTTLWLRRSESMGIAFGELMLWRYLRRRRADERIASGVEVLGLAPTGEPAPAVELEPDDQLEVLHDLSAALETKDPYTMGHSRRVERHVYRTAMALGLHADEIEDLRLAASLHDVGKINVPDRILRKPDGLTHEERRVVQQHAAVGASMVAGTVSEDVVEAILHHHESWDGTGYPDGLAAQDIPLLARIISVADAFDAMTSARPYKPGSSRREAIDALRLNAGVQFDPDVVEAFISTLPASLPVAGAFAIFVVPAQGARKLTAWVKSTAGGSLSTAAGSAGIVALLGTASLVGPSALTPPAEGSTQVQTEAPSSAPAAEDIDDEVLDRLFGAPSARPEASGRVVVERPSELVAAAPPAGAAGAAPSSGGGKSSPGKGTTGSPPVIDQPSQPGDPPSDNDPEPKDPPSGGNDPDPQGPPAEPEPQDPGDDDAESEECESPSQGRGENKGKEKGKGHQGTGQGKGHEKHCD